MLLLPSTPPAKDLKQVHEEVDDVEVEVEGGEDVLIRVVAILVPPTNDELRVVHNVERE